MRTTRSATATGTRQRSRRPKAPSFEENGQANGRRVFGEEPLKQEAYRSPEPLAPRIPKYGSRRAPSRRAPAVASTQRSARARALGSLAAQTSPHTSRKR